MHPERNRSLATLLLRNRHLLVLSVVVVLVAGVSALVGLPRLEDPRIVNRNPIVITPFPGASAERVETLVTELLEEALQEVAEIKDLESTSRAGVSIIAIELLESVDDANQQEIFSEIRDRIGDVVLPEGARTPFIDDKRDPAAFTLILALRWDRDTAPQLGILNRLAEDLSDRLRNVPGTELVRLHGEPDEEITVTVDHAQLAELGLAAADVAARVAAADSKVPAGVLRSSGSDVILEVRGELDSIARVASVPIARGEGQRLVRLGDVAEIRKGWRAPASEIALVNGARSVFVAARMSDGQRIDIWSRETNEIIDRFSAGVGGGISLERVFEQGRYTSQQLGGLASNLLMGAAVVVAVVLVMMGWRQALVVGASLPLVVSLVLFTLQIRGSALHQMSIFGMIIALGLLIDNAIVITDEVTRGVSRGRSRSQAVADAVRHLSVPLLSSTATTVLAFAPILLLPGSAGDFVSSIGASVILALVFSFLVAMTITATLAGLFARREGEGRSRRWWRDGLRSEKVTRLYRKTLGLGLRFPVAAILLACLLPLAGFVAARSLGNEFFPPVDRDMFEVQVWMPSDSSIENTRRSAEAIEEAIREFEQTRHVYWLVGGSFPTVFYNLVMNQDEAPEYAHAIVVASSSEAAKAMIAPLQRRLDDDFPGAQIVVRQFGQGPPVVADVEYRIFGPSIERLQEIGEEVRLALAGHPDVLHTQMTLSRGEPKLWLDADQDEARVAGFSLARLADQLQSNLEGRVGGSVLENLEQVPVRIRQRDERRGRLSDIASTNFVGEDERWLPLTAIGELTLRPELGGITRFDGERTNIVKGYTRNGALPLGVTHEVLDDLAGEGFSLPEGYRLMLGGEAEQDSEAKGSLLLYVPMLVTVMIAVMVLSFRSVRIAVLLGAVAGLSVGLGLLSTWLMGFPVSFNTILGTLGLIGVALNDSIVVLAAIRANPAARSGDRHAVVEEAVGSTRHVLSTTFTTIGGFLPLILITGGDMWPSLAIVLAGGIGGATILALVLVPACYAVIVGGGGLAGRETVAAPA